MRLFRIGVPAALAALVLSACGSSGSSGSNPGTFPIPGGPPPTQFCAGTQVQLANPTPYQSGVSPNLSSITIVANGNSNALYNTYNQWQILLFDNYNDPPTIGGALQLVPDPNGPHPYNSDFYYSSSLQGQYLTPGTTWTAVLSNAQGCEVTLQSFQT
jgi:hypothetical protein